MVDGRGTAKISMQPLESELTEARAGAHWRTHASDTDHEQQEWDIETYEDWTRVLERENKDPSLPRSGLKVCPPNPSRTYD